MFIIKFFIELEIIVILNTLEIRAEVFIQGDPFLQGLAVQTIKINAPTLRLLVFSLLLIVILLFIFFAINFFRFIMGLIHLRWVLLFLRKPVFILFII